MQRVLFSVVVLLLMFVVPASVDAQQIGYYKPTDTGSTPIKVSKFSCIKADSVYVVAAMLNDNPQQGILIGSSPDLNAWTTHGTALTSRGVEDEAMVWSPCLVKDGSTYYMFYTGVTNPAAGQNCQRICVASTTTPTNASSWQRNNNVQFNVGGTLQSWFRPSHIGTVWTSSASADCRDPQVYKSGSTWYMFYTATDSSGPIVGVCSASSILGPWMDHGAALKGTTGAFDSPFVNMLPDGKFILSVNHVGSGQKFARGTSLTPIDGIPNFGSLVTVTNTKKTPISGMETEFIAPGDISYDTIAASLDSYDIRFYKSWFVKETHGWIAAASPGRQNLGLFSPKKPDNTKRAVQDFSVFKYDGQMYAAPMLKYESNKGVLISRSSDLVSWQDMGLAVSTRTPECQSMAWAPHVEKDGGVYYMFYTGVNTPQSGQWCQRICVATTTNPSNPSSWQRDYGVQFVVNGNTQSWFRPDHPGSVWTPSAWADCRDAMVLKHEGTWYMFYSGTDTDGGICGVATAPSIRGPWVDQGAVLKCSGIPESCFVVRAPDGTWIMIFNHAGAGTEGGIKTARATSLVPVNGQPSFSDIRRITETGAIPLRGWAHEFLPGQDYGCDLLSAALGNYEVEFEKAYFVKETWGWTVAASPTPIQAAPLKIGAVLSNSTLLADGFTVYSLTTTSQDSNGGDEVADMRVIFNLKLNPLDKSKARGHLAWGKTSSIITSFGGSWTITPANEGYWGSMNNDYGYEYITPVSCTTSVVGTHRTTTWTFKVNPLWSTNGPLTGNFAYQQILDDARAGGGWTIVPNLSFNVESDVTAPVGTVCVNAGAAYTECAVVELSISCDYSDIASMCFSNDNAVWSSWEPFSNGKIWVLSAGDGDKTIYLQLKDFAGNLSNSFADTIVLLSGIQDTTIAQAKALADGTQVRICNVAVSGVFSDFAYVADSTRTGIRVDGQFQAETGDACDVTGILRTQAISGISAERYIELVEMKTVTTLNPSSN